MDLGNLITIIKSNLIIYFFTGGRGHTTAIQHNCIPKQNSFTIESLFLISIFYLTSSCSHLSRDYLMSIITVDTEYIPFSKEYLVVKEFCGKKADWEDDR